MSEALSWTLDRSELVGKLVRRHAFDFDAASHAFRQHLKCEGVDFNSEGTSPKVLRKVFASSDRKRPTNQTASAPHDVNEPVSPTSLQRDGGNRAGGDCDHMKGTLAAQQLDDNTGDRRCSTEEEDHENMLPERNYQQRNEVAYKIPKAPGSSEKAPAVTATAPSSTTNEPAWNFDRFLEEQRRKEIKHDDEKEKIFQKVLSVLGGNAEDAGASELPPDILRAWEARKEKIAKEAENAGKRQQKLEEDHALAHQRESLKQRHLPESDDSVGEDPLALVTGSNSQGEEEEEGSGVLCHRQPLWETKKNEEEGEEKEEDGGEAVNRHQTAVAGPVRLELGMEPEILEKILDEIEDSAIPVETNSELSRVLDELDKAAGDNPTNTTAPLRVGVQE